MGGSWWVASVQGRSSRREIFSEVLYYATEGSQVWRSRWNPKEDSIGAQSIMGGRYGELHQTKAARSGWYAGLEECRRRRRTNAAVRTADVASMYEDRE